MILVLMGVSGRMSNCAPLASAMRVRWTALLPNHVCETHADQDKEVVADIDTKLPMDRRDGLHSGGKQISQVQQWSITNHLHRYH